MKPRFRRFQSSIAKLQKQSVSVVRTHATSARKTLNKNVSVTARRSLVPASAPPSMQSQDDIPVERWIKNVMHERSSFNGGESAYISQPTSILDLFSNVDGDHVGKRLINRDEFCPAESEMCHYVPRFHEIFESFDPIMSRDCFTKGSDSTGGMADHSSGRQSRCNSLTAHSTVAGKETRCHGSEDHAVTLLQNLMAAESEKMNEEDGVEECGGAPSQSTNPPQPNHNSAATDEYNRAMTAASRAPIGSGKDQLAEECQQGDTSESTPPQQIITETDVSVISPTGAREQQTTQSREATRWRASSQQSSEASEERAIASETPPQPTRRKSNSLSPLDVPLNADAATTPTTYSSQMGEPVTPAPPSQQAHDEGDMKPITPTGTLLQKESEENEIILATRPSLSCPDGEESGMQVASENSASCPNGEESEIKAAPQNSASCPNREESETEVAPQKSTKKSEVAAAEVVAAAATSALQQQTHNERITLDTGPEQTRNKGEIRRPSTTRTQQSTADSYGQLAMPSDSPNQGASESVVTTPEREETILLLKSSPTSTEDDISHFGKTMSASTPLQQTSDHMVITAADVTSEIIAEQNNNDLRREVDPQEEHQDHVYVKNPTQAQGRNQPKKSPTNKGESASPNNRGFPKASRTEQNLVNMEKIPGMLGTNEDQALDCANQSRIQVGQGQLPEWLMQINLDSENDAEFKHVRLKRRPDKNTKDTDETREVPAEETNIFLTMDRITNKTMKGIQTSHCKSVVVPRADTQRRPPSGTPTSTGQRMDSARGEPNKDWFLDQLQKFKSVR